MSELLSQQEVDSLLEGLVQPEAESAPARPDGTRLTLRPYDFRHPNRVSKEVGRALKTMHDAFARSLSTNLSGYLRLLVDARVVAFQQLTYGEFLELLPNPTVMSRVTLAPTEGSIVVDMSPRLIFQMIDRLMGGEGEPPEEIRALTVIEQNLTAKIFQRILGLWEEMWSNVGTVQLEFQGLEMIPQMVQAVAPSEVAIAVGIEIRMREHSDMMNICLPFLVVEPFLAKLASGPGYGGGPRRVAQAPEHLAKRLAKAKVHLAAYLGRGRVTLTQLADIAEGDFLLLDRGPGDPVELWIQGRPLFLGTAGTRRGSRAVAIKGALAEKVKE